MNRRYRTLTANTIAAGLTVLAFGCSGTGTQTEQSPAFCASAASGVPRIEQFTPTAGIEGDTVRIEGQNLRGTTMVSIANQPVLASTISVASNCVLDVKVPSPAGTPRLASVTVVTPLGTSVSTTTFIIATGLPIVSTISPSFGPSGTLLSITGAHLFSASVVEVGGVNVATNVATQALVTALVSATAASGGPVRVRTPVGSALSSTRFTLLTDLLVASGAAIPSTRFSLATIHGLASVWFVDRAAGRTYLARLESTNATLTSFALPGGLTLNGAVALNSLGSAWVGAGRSLAVLSSLSGSLASLTSFTLAGGALQSGRLAVDALGSLWFTDAAATVWAFAPATRALTSYTAPWAAPQSDGRGRGLALTSLGSAWTAVGSVLGLLASTATTLTSFSLWNGAAPLDLAIDSLGSVWFTDQTTPAVLGVRNATGGAVVSIALWAGALVSDLAIDSSRTVWFTDGRLSSIGRYSTDGTLTSYATPSAGSAPGSLAVDRLGSVWYTQLLSIGRLSP